MTIPLGIFQGFLSGFKETQVIENAGYNESAKPVFVGSIPTRCSKKSPTLPTSYLKLPESAALLQQCHPSRIGISGSTCLQATCINSAFEPTLLNCEVPLVLLREIQHKGLLGCGGNLKVLLVDLMRVIDYSTVIGISEESRSVTRTLHSRDTADRLGSDFPVSRKAYLEGAGSA